MTVAITNKIKHMKNIEMVIILSIVLVVAVLIIFYFMRSKDITASLQEKWKDLVTNQTPALESDKIKSLTSLVSSKDGYWEVIGLTKENSEVNMLNYNKNMADIQKVNVTFYWKDKSFKGTGWVPLNNDNIFQFFAEK